MQLSKLIENLKERLTLWWYMDVIQPLYHKGILKRKHRRIVQPENYDFR